MPWMIVKDGEMFCVHKKNEDNTAGEKIKCHMTEDDARAHMAALYANTEDAKSDTVIWYGSEVKAFEGGKVGGYLVRFSTPADPDLTGDFFTKETNFGDYKVAPVLYHHGLDKKLGLKKLGDGDLKTDDLGMWVETQLELADKYQKAIYELAKKGKLGWSSGTAGHLVRREQKGNANWVTHWPIGLDASLTPTPAEPRNVAISLKSVEVSELEADAEGEAITAEAAQRNQSIKEAKMTDEEKKAAEAEAQAAANASAKAGGDLTSIIKTATSTILDTLNAEQQKRDDEEAQKAAIVEMAQTIAEKALKAMPASNRGGRSSNLNLKTKRGDDAFKAFAHYTRTGDYSGIRTGEAYADWQRQQEFEMKTDYHLLEGTQYQGQEAVPTEVMNVIVQKRDPISIARAAKAQVYPAKSNAAVVPIEKVTAQQFGIVSIDGTNTFTTMTSQPLDKLAATIYLFTYNVPVDIQLIDDSVFNVDGWLSSRIGRGLGLTENTYFLMGTGSGQPGGAAYGSTLGVTAAEGTVVDGAELLEQFYKLPGEYRDNVVWVMRGTTEALYRKWQSTSAFPFVGTGGYMGGVGNSGGTNSVAMGTGWFVDVNAKVFNSDAMDAYAASKKPVLVGNFNAGYAIVERKLLTVLRDPYSEASKGIVNLWWYARLGGGITNATALYHILTPSA